MQRGYMGLYWTVLACSTFLSSTSLGFHILSCAFLYQDDMCDADGWNIASSFVHAVGP